MAISPQQLNQSFLVEVDNYEKILDAKLMKRQLSGLPGAALSVDPPSGINSDHIKILREIH
jgi:hypothetical protein